MGKSENVFEIFFHDLKEEVQKSLLEQFQTTADREEWNEGIPIAYVYKSEDQIIKEDK